MSKEGILSNFMDSKGKSVAIPPFDILRFTVLLFCGSLFGTRSFMQEFTVPSGPEAGLPFFR
jgi:hypothetical protein